MRAFCVLFVCAGIAACSPPAAAPAPSLSAAPAATTAAFLTGPDIQRAIIGKSWASHTKRGFAYTLHLDGTGSGAGTNQYAGLPTETLTWEIKGDVLCFHGPRSGTECNRVRTAGANYDFVDSTSGILNNTYTPS